eukprot:8221657-Pyramimonas_sp.AAC.1
MPSYALARITTPRLSPPRRPPMPGIHMDIQCFCNAEAEARRMAPFLAALMFLADPDCASGSECSRTTSVPQ